MEFSEENVPWCGCGLFSIEIKLRGENERLGGAEDLDYKVNL